MRQQKSYTVEERQAFIDAYRRSGKTQRAFCHDAGLNFHSLQYWLHRVCGEKGRKAQARFIEVKSAPTTGTTEGVTLRVGQVALQLHTLPPPSYVAELAREMR